MLKTFGALMITILKGPLAETGKGMNGVILWQHLSLAGVVMSKVDRLSILKD